MLICNPYEIVIQGITQNGKKFRPSDWSERLCGVLSSFDQDHRLSYHQWVRPILVDNVRCVAVDRKLEQISESMFHFLMDFAHDNDLRIIDCKALLAEHGGEVADVPLEDAMQTQQPAPTAKPAKPATAENNTTDAKTTQPQPVEPPAPAAVSTTIRELAPAETALAFAALHRLRPHIRDVAQFQESAELQRAEGYRLLAIFEEGKQNAVAVCGFRIHTNFASGRYLHIDDLVTKDDVSGKGYASQLLEHLKTIAEQEHCTSINADSRVERDRSDAHRLYLRHGFVISCHHFSYFLDHKA